MAARLITILDQIVTQLTAIDGTGNYTHDVSSTGEVLRGGDYDTMPTPSLAVYLGQVDLGHHAELGRIEVNARNVVVIGKVGVGDTSVSTREDAALNLVNDIIIAVTSDRTLSSNGIDVIPSSFALAGTDPKQAIRVVGCVVTFHVHYLADRSTQRI